MPHLSWKVKSPRGPQGVDRLLAALAGASQPTGLSAYGLPAVLCGGDTYLCLGGEGSWLLVKPDGTRHEVHRDASGWWCDCPGWRYRGTCRHVRALAGEGVVRE